MRTKNVGEMAILVLAILATLALVGNLAYASISVSVPTISPNKINEGENASVVVAITSTNDLTGVVMEIGLVDPTNATNISYQNYTADLTGTSRNGWWSYIFSGSAGTYEIGGLYVTDNTSATQFVDFSSSFYGFSVEPAAANTTSNETTTTTTESTTTTTLILTTTTTTIPVFATPTDELVYLFGNPMFILVMSLAIILPIIVLFIVLKGRRKDNFSEPAKNPEGGEKTSDNHEENKDQEESKDQEGNQETKK